MMMMMMMVMLNRGGKKIIDESMQSNDDHHHHWRIAEIVALVVSDQSGSRLVYRPLHFVSTTLSTIHQFRYSIQCSIWYFIQCSIQSGSRLVYRPLPEPAFCKYSVTWQSTLHLVQCPAVHFALVKYSVTLSTIQCNTEYTRLVYNAAFCTLYSAVTSGSHLVLPALAIAYSQYSVLL